jgi:hypothetical protein
MVTILSSPFFVNSVLPFLFIFPAVFAILQKSQIFGEGKKQIDSLIALAIALITISFANAVGIINSLVPFLAVSAAIILVLMILMGLISKEGDFDKAYGDSFKKWMSGLAVIAVALAVLVSTGAWDYLYYNLIEKGSSGIFTNVVFVVLIAIVAWIMLRNEKKDE